MKRAWPWLALSAVLAGLLCWLLIAKADLDLAAIGEILGSVRPEGFALLALLIGLNTWLSALRWRLIARRTEEVAPPAATAFSLTALGLALGQVMPVQLSTPVTRALGARLFGGKAFRAVAASLYEQVLDLALMLILGAASLAALLMHDARPWLFLAPAFVAGGFLGMRLVLPRVDAWVAKAEPRLAEGRIGPKLLALHRTGALALDLSTSLYLVTVARFAILVLMAGATSYSAGMEVPLLALAAALPLVALATALPITPAGLGLNEWTFVGMLTAFGAPFEVAATWAVINRLLVTAASLAVGGAGLLTGLAVAATPRQPKATGR